MSYYVRFDGDRAYFSIHPDDFDSYAVGDRLDILVSHIGMQPYEVIAIEPDPQSGFTVVASHRPTPTAQSDR